jgi:hypothetical protein
MFQLGLNRAKSAMEEVKQALEGIQPVLELKPVSQQALYVIPAGTTLDQINSEMRRLMSEENVNHYRLGLLYDYTVENELAEKAGFKDAPAYFRKHLADLSPATLATYRSVAKAFTEQVAVRFSVISLYLLLTYKEITGLKFNHEEPGPTLIEVLGKNGEVTKKPFSECSVEEMRKALQLKRKPTSSKPVPAEDVAQAEKYRAALKGQFSQGSDVKLKVHNLKGTSVLDIQNIPMTEVGTMLEALRDHVPPSSEPQPTE